MAKHFVKLFGLVTIAKFKIVGKNMATNMATLMFSELVWKNSSFNKKALCLAIRR